ncbi:MAG: crossover junction endodeoxyribonuclease RuvC [Elusimicrobiota bacterium]|nr:crossover junction endodeoxyribonuclease RuvC [Elusimicrobiota bacterium]
MIILGVDPGLAKVGWAVVEKIKNEKLKMKNCGVIKTNSKMALPERLLTIYSSLEKIIKKYNPKIVSLEKQYLYQNSSSTVAISQARGVILLAAAKNHLKVIEHGPKEVKIAVTGYGAAGKVQVREMFKRLLNLKSVPRPDDVSDAIAVAFCCMNTISLKVA